MSFDDDFVGSFVPDDDTPSSGDWGAESSLKALVGTSGSSANSLTGWRRLLKLESEGCKVDVGGKCIGSEVNFELHHSAPPSVLAAVIMNIHMIFGSSLQSRLRGFWDDSSFTIEFHIVADIESPLGITIASNRTNGYDTVPVAYTVGGSRRISPCLQEGAISAIMLRMLRAAFSSWHSSYFHTAQECRAAKPVSQKEALQILTKVLDRPCRVEQSDHVTGCIITCTDEGFLPIPDSELNDPSMDYHVRIIVTHGCIAAIDIDGHSLTPERQRALDAARIRLGLHEAPLPVSNAFAATILDLITQPFVPKDPEATPNLFLYVSAYVALSLKNCLVFANSHTGEELLRPNVMPFVPLNDVSLYAIDNGLCGLSLQDALCCIPHDVMVMIFKSAISASEYRLSARGSTSGSYDLCQPWPSFLLNEVILNADRSGIIGDAGRRADTSDKSQGKSGQSAQGTKQAAHHLNAGLGVENKKLREWQSSVSSALHALQNPALINLMGNARAGIPSSEQRQQVLRLFLSSCAEKSDPKGTIHFGAPSTAKNAKDDQEDMAFKVCGFILRTLPFLPVHVQGQLVWFGDATPWEEGLVEDVSACCLCCHMFVHCIVSLLLVSFTSFAWSDPPKCIDRLLLPRHKRPRSVQHHAQQPALPERHRAYGRRRCLRYVPPSLLVFL